MNFCVKCGKDCEESIDGLCIECWLSGRELVALPHHVDLAVCAGCGEFLCGNAWVSKDPEIAVQDAAADSLSVVKGAEVECVTTSVTEQDPRTFLVDVSAECSVMGYPAQGGASTIVRIKNTVCKRCSRQTGNYYEAILQLRFAEGKPDSETEKEAMAVIENSVMRQAANNRSLFITKTESVPGGTDIYLSSISLGKSLVKELSDVYCAETKESPKLVGQTADGQDMYRITYLVRLPDFGVGDVVSFQDRCFEVTRIGGNGGKLTDLEGFRERSFRRSDMPEIRLIRRRSELSEVTVVSRSGTEIQILDPDNLSVSDVRIPEGYGVGETVKVVKIEGVPYLVP